MIIEVKICENCRHRNPVQAVECEQCGYDLTFAFPQTIDDASLSGEIPGNYSGRNQVTYVMEEVRGDETWELVFKADESVKESINHEISLGRDCEIFNNQFNSSNYTSRTHAKIRIHEGDLQVMDASTNGTYVDEKRIPKMEWTNLPDGCVIRFADISFIARRKQGAD